MTGQDAHEDRASTLQWYGWVLIAVGALSAVMFPGSWLLASGGVLLVGVVLVWLAVRARRRAEMRQERDS